MIYCVHLDLRQTLIKSAINTWTDKLDNTNTHSAGSNNDECYSLSRVTPVSIALILTALADAALANLITISK